MRRSHVAYLLKQAEEAGDVGLLCSGLLWSQRSKRSLNLTMLKALPLPLPLPHTVAIVTHLLATMNSIFVSLK